MDLRVTLLFFGLLLLCPLTSHAYEVITNDGGAISPVVVIETDSNQDIPRGNVAYFMLGSGSMDLSELNDHLRANGYSTFYSDTVSFGFGGQHVTNSGVLLDGVFFANSQQGHAYVAGDRYETRLTGGALVGNIGYLLVDDKNIRIYPMVGVSINTLRLDINSSYYSDFDYVLTDPNYGTTLSRVGISTAVSLGVDLRLNADRNLRSDMIGFRLGYAFPSATDRWQYNDTDPITNGPNSVGLKGAYFFVTYSPKCWNH